MLDAISDFWKPAKKNQSAEKIDPNELVVGSAIGFGFVPQASLSGRRLQVTGVQTYRFGEEKLTSFLLAPDKSSSTPQISMIVAEAEDEQYLAISRRVSINDRMKLFNSQDLEQVVEKTDVTTLPCKDGMPDFKGWTVASYKREMQKMTGYLFKGDYRTETLPALDQAQEFKYTLLVSENNEHAIEIEKYKDGRMEVYATIYRRISDIGEITHPAHLEALKRPDLKLATSEEEKSSQEAAKKADDATKPKAEQQAAKEKPAAEVAKAEPPAKAKQPEPKKEPVEYKELKKEEAPSASAPAKEDAADTTPSVPTQTATKQETIKKEKAEMATYESNANGALKDSPAALQAAVANKNESKLGRVDGDSIECELRVANRVIEEAIRNEMRLSDVVRRIIELPVAEQEMVHLPVTLSDEDYALLAIRYGVTPGDKQAIHQRIIDDLGSFSGSDKAAT